MSIDIVFADVDNPGGSGFALAGWMRDNHPTIDVIHAGTVAKATEKAEDLCEEGPTASKPYDHQLLLDHMYLALRGIELSRRRGRATPALWHGHANNSTI